MELLRLPNIYTEAAEKIWQCNADMQKHNIQQFGPMQSILAGAEAHQQAEKFPSCMRYTIQSE